ncbi:hypothetical protein DPMN_182587 [Dreissena polymorpha]|uniref:Uncharacterized protein n=1 Tax=Dreissena polymorpha TaxID=45954 RepID=A0A9D4I4Q7_DREPO|nr:hypothetical protein DPMN_182587 [Dreissena polymorpha]
MVITPENIVKRAGAKTLVVTSYQDSSPKNGRRLGSPSSYWHTKAAAQSTVDNAS